MLEFADKPVKVRALGCIKELEFSTMAGEPAFYRIKIGLLRESDYVAMTLLLENIGACAPLPEDFSAIRRMEHCHTVSILVCEGDQC